MLIKPIHSHDCAKCYFITATHDDHGLTFDWYICKAQGYTSMIGRYGSEGSQYWSMPLSTIEDNLGKPAYIADTKQYAWSERMQIAYMVYSWYREDPQMAYQPCPYCGCAEQYVERADGEWPSCPCCNGV